MKRTAAPLIQAIDRAIGLCTQTLTYARDEGPELTRTRFRLRELLDEVASDLAVLGEGVEAQAGEAPKVMIEVSADVIIVADRDQIYRVFANLGRNAFEAGARRVTLLMVETPDSGLTVDASDDGPGLARMAREGLFEPFKGSARKGGTGLGLVIARDVMRLHGGDIVLAHTGDDGTVFRLTFPTGD